MFGAIAIVLVGVLAAWCGAAVGVDSIVHYVFGIVDQIPNDPISILKPMYNPEPMYTHAYRPLSTALVKLGGAVFGRTDEGLQALTFAHALFLIPYGYAARHCLVVHGVSRTVASIAAITSMLTPTVLFSAWTIPEFDMVGGIFVLTAAAELKRKKLWTFVPAALGALLTKETSAVLMLAYLIAAALMATENRKNLIIIASVYLALLFAAVAPILLVEPPVVTSFNLSSNEFEWTVIPMLAFHNASQVFYVMGPAGALLLVWGVGLPRLKWCLIVGAAVLLVATPVLRHYNHYESIIFSDWGWVLLWVVVALIGLVLNICDSSDKRILAATVVLGFLGLLAGPVLASFSRADLSARLYAPLLPMLHGLILCGVVAVFREQKLLYRVAGVVVAACFFWLPIAGAVSAWQFTNARFPVELTAKRQLIAQLPSGCPLVFYTNRDQELAQEELDALGNMPDAVKECTQLVQLSVTETGPGYLWDYPQRLAGFDQYRSELDTEPVEEALRARREFTRPIHLYIQSARSTMDEFTNRVLDTDFEWATRRMPETDIGFFRQTMGIMYTSDTPLERLFEDAAPYKKKFSMSFFQLPLWLNEALHRVVRGVALVETYNYRADLYSIPLGTKPSGTPDPRGSPRTSSFPVP